MSVVTNGSAVQEIRDRIEGSIDAHFVPQGIERTEYVDGLVVKIAASKRLRVPLEVIGLECGDLACNKRPLGVPLGAGL